MGAVRAQFGVEVPDQLPARVPEPGGSQPGERRAQLRRRRESPVQQLGFERDEPWRRRRVARAWPGLVDVDGTKAAEQHGRQYGQAEAPGGKEERKKARGGE
ncbi:hypothetical protein [Streptomyces sp. NPDC051001]|uniref:hypothetical protein n=1 Tax=Streptomyces sp. NPDC051001 TaxID=3155795 RepID=UPI003413003A